MAQILPIRYPRSCDTQHRRYSKPISEPQPPWPASVSIAQSSTVKELKSSFQAYAVQLPNPSDCTGMRSPDECVPVLLAHLAATVRHTKRATHAMWAWRISNMESGSSDGGESGAGERLLRLLELSSCTNVILVVFRWYGGVKLGSQRWRCISSVAKEALHDGGFMGGPASPMRSDCKKEMEKASRRR